MINKNKLIWSLQLCKLEKCLAFVEDCALLLVELYVFLTRLVEP